MTLNSPLASPKATIDRLTQWQIGTRKSLGQHFLIDDGVVGRILRLAAPVADEAVIEVGPGIGTLTEALLLVGARVFAIEKDERLLPVLADIASRYPGRFTFTHADALSVLAVLGTTCTTGITDTPDALNSPPSSTLSVPATAATSTPAGNAPSATAAPGTSATALVANLPYAVAATIVLDCFQHLPTVQSATVMVQKEVAERMAAEPGSKDYGAYTVKLRLFAKPAARFTVSPSSFLPPPRVDSAVIRLDRHDEQLGAAELRACFTVIEAAFAERRKTVRNSMRSSFAARGLDPAQVDALLAASAISPTARGETLTVADFRRIGHHFAASSG
ncbi:MAG: 16S rRNA (adenine(1518)-N(6)/adenine(1519)-N(6))-dimethyltransferase [Coriobacteriales bacterium]|nr:16S rRNA (adenine(1518)-N(6)/adenine(1519)-N(6))-dimethyltransferase [Coriobacteriales bacterium]